jgi:hypothetical protein
MAANSSSLDVGISQIPQTQAVLLPDKTYPFAQDPRYYIASLSVFHHLHCLVIISCKSKPVTDICRQNNIRKALYPDYYHYPPDEEEASHLNHCVEAIRQSLMCFSDTSVIVWQWDVRSQQAKPKADVVHTCKNFGKIQNWGRMNRARMSFNESAFIEDDILDR